MVRALLAVFAVVLVAPLAEAQTAPFKCSTLMGNENITQVWQSRCIPYWISLHGTVLDGKQTLVRDCFDQWAKPACTDLVFTYSGTTAAVAGYSDLDPYSNQNVIVSIESESEWVDSKQEALEPGLLAITLTTYLAATGEIIDADILLHASRFTFEDVRDRVACLARVKQPFDLRNTLTHEMGHWIGFGHSDVVNSTMQASAMECEIIKRDLLQQDIDGLCTVYPKGGETATCKPPASYTPSGLDPTPFRNQCDPNRRSMMGGNNAGGCSCGDAPAADLLAVLMLVGGAVVLGRRPRPGRRLR